jgi:hypothetical protein
MTQKYVAVGLEYDDYHIRPWKEGDDEKLVLADDYDALAARLAEAERAITAARQKVGQLAPINFRGDKKSSAALAAAEAAWCNLDNYHYKHLRTADSGDVKQ